MDSAAKDPLARRRATCALGSILALLLLTHVPAPARALPPVNVDARGVAAEGYDVVAYFTVGEAVEGSSGLAYEWNGASWWFSNGEHLQLFRDDPEKYAPRYGGY